MNEKKSLLAYFDENSAAISKFHARISLAIEEAAIQVESMRERIAELESEIAELKQGRE